MKTITKFQLFTAFMDRKYLTIQDSNGGWHTCIISSIQHEDGSGKSFNIVSEGGQNFHIRTVD